MNGLAMETAKRPNQPMRSNQSTSSKSTGDLEKTIDIEGKTQDEIRVVDIENQLVEDLGHLQLQISDVLLFKILVEEQEKVKLDREVVEIQDCEFLLE